MNDKTGDAPATDGTRATIDTGVVGETDSGAVATDDMRAESDADDGMGAESSGRSSRWRRLSRGLTVVVLLGFLLFWVWAFSPWARRENPARLNDRDFAAWADRRCALSQAAIDALPSPRQVDSFRLRAEQIDRGTDEIEALVADLLQAASARLSEGTTHDGPTDAELVGAWIEDWGIYLEDRRSHAARLRDTSGDVSDHSLRFLLSDVMSGGVYTERMDGFARLNDMDSCQIPGDV